jgi:hypothetical protein
MFCLNDTMRYWQCTDRTDMQGYQLAVRGDFSVVCSVFEKNLRYRYIIMKNVVSLRCDLQR